MTICIVYKQNGKIYCASDTKISAGDSCGKDKIEKIFKKGGLIYCCAGDLKLNQALRYDFKYNLPKNYNNIKNVIYNDFRKNFKKFFKNNPEYLSKKGEFKDELIIVAENKIFILNSDFSITEPKLNYYCIGSGSDSGFAGLYALNKIKRIPTKDKIKFAIEAAGEFSNNCNKEIKWY